MDVNALTAVKVRGGTEGVAGCVSVSAPWVCDESVTCNDWVNARLMKHCGTAHGLASSHYVTVGLSMGFMFHVCDTIVTTPLYLWGIFWGIFITLVIRAGHR